MNHEITYEEYLKKYNSLCSKIDEFNSYVEVMPDEIIPYLKKKITMITTITIYFKDQLSSLELDAYEEEMRATRDKIYKYRCVEIITGRGRSM